MAGVIFNTMSDIFVKIQASTQSLSLYSGNKLLQQYSVSTAKNGLGEIMGSEMTPRGRHEIYAKIGGGCAINTVFVARKPTGEIYTPQLSLQFPERDWMLTRILWLNGLEEGKNCAGNVDSRQRYIYIHGCPASAPMGMPLSHGCIRMRNEDVIALFDQVIVGTHVLIEA